MPAPHAVLPGDATITTSIEEIAEELGRTGYIVLDKPLLASLALLLLGRCQEADAGRGDSAADVAGRGGSGRCSRDVALPMMDGGPTTAAATEMLRGSAGDGRW